MRWGKWPILDHFWVRGWPNRSKKGDHVLIFFPMFSVFFVYLLTTFRPCFQPVLFSIFIDFLIFLLQIWHNTARNIHTHNHTHTHTCSPAIDRDLESGLSKSHTRKNQRKMPEKGKVRRISGEVSLRYRRANRSSAAKWRKTNRTIWLLVPSEISLIFRKR